MIYGYARVSTKGQAKDGNSLEVQVEQLKSNGAEIIFSDSYTGTKTSRPEFDKLLEKLQIGDKLIVTKLDRFARSVTGGVSLIENLLDKGIVVHVLNMGIMDNTPTGKLIRTIMLGFAEFERDMIVERTREGKEIARANGKRVDGRPFIEIPKADIEKFSKKQKEGLITVREICKELGISRSKWYTSLVS